MPDQQNAVKHEIIEDKRSNNWHYSSIIKYQNVNPLLYWKCNAIGYLSNIAWRMKDSIAILYRSACLMYGIKCVNNWIWIGQVSWKERFRWYIYASFVLHFPVGVLLILIIFLLQSLHHLALTITLKFWLGFIYTILGISRCICIIISHNKNPWKSRCSKC